MSKDFLDLNVKEKIALFNGLNSWQTREIPNIKLPKIRMSDGPHGIRREKDGDDEMGLAFIDGSSYQATCFPPAALSACSFDRNLLYAMGKALAIEAKELDIDLILGPGVNIKRSPLCGRNFEYFSEDSLLSGELAAAMINGIQDQHVFACVKHFAVNNQETNRLISSSNLNEDVLHEIYLKPFEIAIKSAKPGSIMCSYNRINGIHASENSYLLKEILRDKWHYEGMVVSDWGATNDVVDSFKNGLNLEMPGGDVGEINTLINAYDKKIITDNDVNDALMPTYNFIRKCENNSKIKNDDFDKDKHLDIAYKIASESIVLAKNDGILPLKEEKVLFVGDLLRRMHYQGGGSSHINPTRLIQPIDFIDPNDFFSVYDSKADTFNKEELELVKRKAALYDKIVISLGTLESDDSEGYDRENMKIRSYMIDIVNEIFEVNQNIILIIQSGSPIDISDIHNKVKATLICYMPGCMGGKAIIDILYGKVNPCGRLAETWPLKLEDTYLYNQYPSLNLDLIYSEGFYVGYKYNFFTDIKPLYPFGHGLTYSDVIYSDFSLKDNCICFKIKNKSNVSCKETIQIYRRQEANLKYKDLVYFDKVFIEPQEIKIIEIKLKDNWFKYYISSKHDFDCAKGTFYFSISKDSLNDIHTFEIEQQNGFLLPKRELDSVVNYFSTKANDKKGNYSLNTRIVDINNSFLGRRVYNIIIKILKKKSGDKETFISLKRQIDGLPIRGILIAPGMNGGLTRTKLQGLVDILNGKIFKGLKKVFSK